MLREGGITARVVSVVAERKGVSESALPPLYESVETSALEELFEHTTADTKLVVQFSYAGYRITIDEFKGVSIEE